MEKNKRTEKKIVLAASVALLVCSCIQKSDPYRSDYIVCKVYSEQTKGMVADSSSLTAEGFKMTTYLDEDYFKEGDTDTPTGKAGKYFGPLDVSYDNTTSGWVIGTSPAPKWVAIDSMRFWCWSPKSLTQGTRTIKSTDSELTGSNSLEFSYKMPAGGQKSGGKACDASNQSDLLFAYNCRWYQPEKAGSESQEVNIRFYHALSQINFIVYPAESGASQPSGSLRKDFKIVDIALKNVADTASCTITGTPYYSMPSSGANLTKFEWSGLSGSSTYTQNYDADFSTASSSSVPSGWTYKDYSGKAHFFCNNSFFIIPETIADDAALEISFMDKSSSEVVTKMATLKNVGTSDKTTPVTKWLPGYRYTYRLAISGDLKEKINFTVTLEDWVTVNDSMRF